MAGAVKVLSNADVRVIDHGGTRAEAIAWRDGRIVAVGTNDEVEAIAGDGALVSDARGAVVLPGFIDPHHHPCIVALYGSSLRLTRPSVTDIPSLQRAIAALAKTAKPGEWLVATEWDETNLAEHRAPTRAELDDAAPGHPVFALHYSCHRAVASSKALELAAIDKDTADPSGGAIERGRGGVPTGLLIERGICAVEQLARASLVATDGEGFLARLAAHHRAMAAGGITRVCDATVPGDLATLYREASRRGMLTVPTVMMPVSVRGWLAEPWDVLDGPPTGEDDGMLSVGPVKLVFDGAPGCAMCLGWLQTAGVFLRSIAMTIGRGSLDPLRTSMSVEPRIGAQIRTGIQIYRRDEAKAVVAAAVERGFSVATHAIGNEAVDVALEAYEAAKGSLDRAGLPRLEHATFLSPDLVDRIAGVGAAVVVQPYFTMLPALAGAASIPGVRYSPLRWLLDAKVLVSGSSDHPVASFDPIAAIAAAVNRKTARGDVHEGDQRISIDEAIALYTRAAAAATGCLSQCGTLETGKRADLVVVDGSVDTEDGLATAKVRATFIGGELVFGAP